MSLVVILAVVLGALAQTIAGFGFALLCGPFLIAALGQATAVRLILLLSSIISVVLLTRKARHARLGDGLLLLAPGVVVTPAVAWVLHHLDVRTVTVAAGVVTLLRYPLNNRWGLLCLRLGRPATLDPCLRALIPRPLLTRRSVPPSSC